jgi:TPR repeat protein
MMNKVNTQLLSVPGFDGLAVKTRLIMLTLLTVFILLPTITQADGLFDFQMKLAKKGNAEAQFKVGEMYETGFGVKKDMTEARNWINKSAAQGNENAGFKLLYWDVEKNGLKGGNKAKVENLKAKAKEGNPQAQYYVGKMHANGVGLKKSSDEALKWLNKAAFVGILEAEREAVVVRENKEREDMAAKKRAEEKRRADLKAKQQREKQAKLEQQRKLEAKKQADAKARADKAAQQNKAAEQQRAQAKKAADDQARLKAQQDAARKREAEKQALLKKRAEEEKSRKAEFESDPCSGKSARFLSTCK